MCVLCVAVCVVFSVMFVLCCPTCLVSFVCYAVNAACVCVVCSCVICEWCLRLRFQLCYVGCDVFLFPWY